MSTDQPTTDTGELERLRALARELLAADAEWRRMQGIDQMLRLQKARKALGDAIGFEVAEPPVRHLSYDAFSGRRVPRP